MKKIPKRKNSKHFYDLAVYFLLKRSLVVQKYKSETYVNVSGAKWLWSDIASQAKEIFFRRFSNSQTLRLRNLKSFRLSVV